MWLSKPKTSTSELDSSIVSFENKLQKLHDLTRSPIHIVRSITGLGFDVEAILERMNPNAGEYAGVAKAMIEDTSKVDSLIAEMDRDLQLLEKQVQPLRADVERSLNEGLDYGDACAIADIDPSLMGRLGNLESNISRYEELKKRATGGDMSLAFKMAAPMIRKRLGM